MSDKEPVDATTLNIAPEHVFTGQIARIAQWQPTEYLRKVIRLVPIDEHTAKRVEVLQQLWHDPYMGGATEWRDVPIYDEENAPQVL